MINGLACKIIYYILKISKMRWHLLPKEKNELENRVEELLTERESLNNTLDDTSDKIILLERHAREQDCQIIGSHREMCELRTNNAVLSDRLESLARSCSSSSPSSVQMSLL